MKKGLETQVYQLRIDIADIRPPIWRRILVRGNATLNRLHAIIQELFNWEGYHLHEFEIMGVEYTDDPESQAEFGMRSEKRVRLEELGLSAGVTFTYLYDFGDSWYHQIKVEKVLPPDAEGRYPVCLTGKRAGPPEDCGGIWGHAMIVEVLKRVESGELKWPSPDEGPPEDEDEDEDEDVDYEARELLQWLDEDYDPEAFDLEAVNAALRRFQR